MAARRLPAASSAAVRLLARAALGAPPAAWLPAACSLATARPVGAAPLGSPWPAAAVSELVSFGSHAASARRPASGFAAGVRWPGHGCVRAYASARDGDEKEEEEEEEAGVFAEDADDPELGEPEDGDVVDMDEVDEDEDVDELDEDEDGYDEAEEEVGDDKDDFGASQTETTAPPEVAPAQSTPTPPQRVPYSPHLVNFVNLIGRISSDPVLIQMPGGAGPVNGVQFELQVESHDNDSGYDIFEVEAWGDEAARIVAHFRKDSEVLVDGRLLGNDATIDVRSPPQLRATAVKRIDRSLPAVPPAPSSELRNLAPRYSSSEPMPSVTTDHLGRKQMRFRTESEKHDYLLKHYDEFYDNRRDKLNPRAPDFKRKVTGEVIWLASPPQAVVEELDMRLRIAEQQRAERFAHFKANFNEYNDNRPDKAAGMVSARYPDFSHPEYDDRAIWLWSAPEDVKEFVKQRDNEREGGAGGDDSESPF